MWEDVYQSALDRGFSASRAAQQAWGAVKNAGYYKDARGVWRGPRKSARRKATKRPSKAKTRLSEREQRKRLNAALRGAT